MWLFQALLLCPTSMASFTMRTCSQNRINLNLSVSSTRMRTSIQLLWGHLVTVAGKVARIAFIWTTGWSHSRICPARYVSLNSAWLAIVQILAAFTISPKRDESGKAKLEFPDYVSGLVVWVSDPLNRMQWFLSRFLKQTPGPVRSWYHPLFWEGSGTTPEIRSRELKPARDLGSKD